MRKPLLTIMIIFFMSQIWDLNAQNFTFNENYDNETLTKVLWELESVFDVQFSYVESIVSTVAVSQTLQGNSLEDIIKILQPALNLKFTRIDESTYVITGIKRRSERQLRYTMRGAVIDEETGQGLPGVNIVTLPGAQFGTSTDDQGNYSLTIPGGYQQLRFSFVGFKSHLEKIEVTQDQSLNISLKADFIEMKSVEITPGAFEIGELSNQSLSVSKEEILHSPIPFRDIFRTLKIIPGYANDDISAKPRIRGGHWDETAIILDGLEIYESSHIEEVEGLASIFDTDILENIKVLTGGFGPKYTDKLSGIIEMQTPAYVAKNETTFSIDFLAAKAAWSRSFGDNTSVIFNARRGYLDLILDTEEVGLKPKYYDIFGKINHAIGSNHLLSMDLLYANDDLGFDEAQGLLRSEFFNSVRKNFYWWGNWKWQASNNFYSHNTIGYQSLVKVSDFAFEASLTPDNADDRQSKIFSISNRNYWDAFANHSIEFGLEFKGFKSKYEFLESRINTFLTTQDFIWTEIINVDTQFRGSTTSLYFQDTWSMSERLRLMFGGRLSHQSYTSEINVAPRLALNYQFSDKFNGSIAYGIYYQPDNFQKIRSYIGQERPFDTNAKSTHYTASLSYNSSSTLIRGNFFYKDIERLFDDYRYDFFNRSSLAALVETPFNTTHGESYGFEIFTRHTFRKNLISLSYALSESTIKNAQGEQTFRDFDYRHVIGFNSIFRLKNNYSFSALWTFHTGGPYTPSQVEFIGEPRFNSDAAIYFDFGPKNSARLPNYHSLDVKIEKTIYGKNSTFNFFLSIINLYDHQNIRNFLWDNTGVNPDGSVLVERSLNSGPQLFVSPGIKLTF